MSGQTVYPPPGTAERIIPLAEELQGVHTAPIANEPGEIQNRLTYLNEVEKAFFSIGETIAEGHCSCEWDRLDDCERCKIMEKFAGLRRSLKNLRENQDNA